jgi:hypothetical protein
MVSFKKPSEIFLENLELKIKNDHLQRIEERQERHPSLFQNEEQPEKKLQNMVTYYDLKSSIPFLQISDNRFFMYFFLRKLFESLRNT